MLFLSFNNNYFLSNCNDFVDNRNLSHLHLYKMYLIQCIRCCMKDYLL